jgi:hypothetical protein
MDRETLPLMHLQLYWTQKDEFFTDFPPGNGARGLPFDPP